MLIAVDIMMRIVVPHHAQCVSRNPVHKNKNKKTMASLPNAPGAAETTLAEGSANLPPPATTPQDCAAIWYAVIQLHCGSTGSSQHLNDARFFLLSFPVSHAFSFQSYRVPVRGYKAFFLLPLMLPFRLPTPLPNINQSLYLKCKKEFSLPISGEAVTLQNRCPLGRHRCYESCIVGGKVCACV